jgi:hypothetical protein
MISVDGIPSFRSLALCGRLTSRHIRPSHAMRSLSSRSTNDLSLNGAPRPSLAQAIKLATKRSQFPVKPIPWEARRESLRNEATEFWRSMGRDAGRKPCNKTKPNRLEVRRETKPRNSGEVRGEMRATRTSSTASEQTRVAPKNRTHFAWRCVAKRSQGILEKGGKSFGLRTGRQNEANLLGSPSRVVAKRSHGILEKYGERCGQRGPRQRVPRKRMSVRQNEQS